MYLIFHAYSKNLCNSIVNNTITAKATKTYLDIIKKKN